MTSKSTQHIGISNGKPWLHVVAAGALVFIAITAACTTVPMGLDEGIWNYMARLWLDGKPVYTHSLDAKPPAIFEIYSLAYRIAGTNTWLVRLLGTIAMTTTAVLLYDIARRLGNHLAGLLAMLLFGLCMSWQAVDVSWKAFDGGYSAQTESFMVLFVVLSAWILIRACDPRPQSVNKRTLCAARPRPSPSLDRDKLPSTGPGILLAGIFMGLAISFKQVGVFSALGLFLLYMGLRSAGRAPASRPARDVSLFGTGCIGGMVLLCLPVWLSGVSFGEYFWATWQLPLQPGTGNSDIIDRLGCFWQAFGCIDLIPLYIMIALFVAFFRDLRSAAVPVVGLALWAGADFVGTNSSGFYYGHQLKQMMPSLALIAGIGASALCQRWEAADAARGSATLQRRGAIFVAAIVLLCLPYRSLNSWLHGDRPANACGPVADWVRTHTAADDPVLVIGWDASCIMAQSQRVCPSRHFTHCFLRVPGAKEEVLRDLAAKPPRVVVVPVGQADQNVSPKWLTAIVDDGQYKLRWSTQDIQVYMR